MKVLIGIMTVTLLAIGWLAALLSGENNDKRRTK